MPVRGVLLDIDGTLVDSNDAHAHAWVTAFAEHGYDVPFEQVRRLIGMGGDKLVPEVCGLSDESKEGKAISKRRGEVFTKEFLPTLKPTPGAERLLKLLSGMGLKLAVASSAKEDELKELLGVCGADKYIEAATSSDDAENSKPDPDIVHAALAELRLPAADVILLGDTPYDVQAARKAGVGVVGVRCGGWSDKDLQADAVYADPGDLADRIGQSPFAE